MDNFDLKKYLAENKLLKENRYDLDDPNSPLYILNNNDQDVAILNNMTKKYGKDVVLMWLSSGEYGDRLYENNLTESEYKSQLNENKFEMIGSDVDELLDAVSLVNGKNIAKLKPLDTTGHQIADDKFSIEVELDNSEFIQKINSFLEENGFQSKLYKTK